MSAAVASHSGRRGRQPAKLTAPLAWQHFHLRHTRAHFDLDTVPVLLGVHQLDPRPFGKLWIELDPLHQLRADLAILARDVGPP